MNRIDLSLVQKELGKIPEHIRAKLYRWMKGIQLLGLEEMRKIPGYHDEPLRGNRMGQRSVRLNKSYRVIYIQFTLEDITTIRVLEVVNHEY